MDRQRDWLEISCQCLKLKEEEGREEERVWFEVSVARVAPFSLVMLIRKRTYREAVPEIEEMRFKDHLKVCKRNNGRRS